jgi:hypothetical protein
VLRRTGVPDVRFTLVGDGDEYARVAARALGRPRTDAALRERLAEVGPPLVAARHVPEARGRRLLAVLADAGCW